MTVIKGDLLKITEGIIFHQVNCMGLTGGLAGALRRKFPKAFYGTDSDWICSLRLDPAVPTCCLV